MSEQFDKMTVLELRKAAKDMGVKLGAGISKQGIIDKLTEAAGHQQPENASVSAPAQPPVRPVRSAAIITDEEPYDEDDVPVLTPNASLRPAPRPAASPAPAAAPAPASSSLGTISSKAPAFTMEGSRAWHNPRAYQGQNASYQRAPQGWGTPRPASHTQPADRAYAPRPAQQPARPDMRSAAPQQPQYPARFGPAQPQEQEERPMDYQPAAPAYTQPAQDYAAPRENPAFSQPAAYTRPQQPYPARETPAPAASIPEILAAGECKDGEGVLEVHPDGYGFLRTNHYLSGKNDIYVANAQIRRFNLRSGDYIMGKTRPQRENDRYSALLYITEINGHTPEENPDRASFEEMTAIYPKRALALSVKGESWLSLRLADLLCPIGFGQRALIQLPSKVSKKALVQKLANNIAKNHSKAHVMVMLVDEKPEEVTVMQEAVKGEVVFSTFDDLPENQGKVCELALERALRLVEQKKDVVLLLDDLGALVRAYHAAAPQNVRVLANGLTVTAMNKPKRLLASARNTREGGTLTLLCFAQAGAAPLADPAVLGEFKAACNAHWVMTAQADAQGLAGFDFAQSKTLRSELLLSPEALEAAAKVQEMISSDPQAQAQWLALIEKTQSNAELIEKMDAWMELLKN